MSISKMLAMSVGMVVATGPAMAVEAWSSFTDRVQEHQGIGQARGYRAEQEYVASEPAAPTETGSFTDRVQEHQGFGIGAPLASEGGRSAASQGIGLGAQPGEEYRATSIPAEAASFITRVEMSQGVGPAGTEQGAAGGEPSTR